MTSDGSHLELLDDLFYDPRASTSLTPQTAAPIAAPVTPVAPYVPRLPGVGTTVLVTFLLGLLGLVPATIHTKRAARVGLPTNRYWKAFGWTLAAAALVSVALYASLFLGVFRAANGSSAAVDPSSSAEGLAGSVLEGGSQAPSAPGGALPSAPGDIGGVETPNARIVLPNIAQICTESSGVGPYAASAAGNAKTSCPFAEAVRSAYDSSGANGTNVFVDAFSPVTEKWYTVQCDGEAPTTCTGTGGLDILIFVYSSDTEVLRSD